MKWFRWLILGFILLTPCSLARGQGVPFHEIIISFTGPVSNASVRVCDGFQNPITIPCQPTSQLFATSDLSGSPLPNPLNADISGNFENIFGAPGEYTIQVTAAQFGTNTYYVSMAGVFGTTPGLGESVQISGSEFPIEPEINFIPGANINITGIDDPANQSTDLTISVTGILTPVNQTLRVCTIIVGADNGTTLLNSDIAPLGQQCFVPANSTIVEVEVAANAGTPSVQLDVNHQGTQTNLLSAALSTAASGGVACSNTGGTLGIDGVTTCSATLVATGLVKGDYIETATATAGGTASRMSIFVTFGVNQ